MATRTKKRTTKKTGARSKTSGTTTTRSRRTTSTRKKTTTARRKAAPTAARRTATTSSRSKKRSPTAGFMKPMQPDNVLAPIVGSKPIPRTQVTKKLWSYIKRHDLQDANKRTMIIADAKLKPVFGGKRKIDMFQMTKLVSRHLIDVK
ncbi:MAG: SWIB/MDM2 domain-containing protein [Planctomycetes bacterium]|nr:SWIB/MDM2 domain-containing protein [Planctomycetota bacterium]